MNSSNNMDSKEKKILKMERNLTELGLCWVNMNQNGYESG